MTGLTLVTGNKAYSPWSLRPRLLMRQAGIDFEEIRLPLYTETWTARIDRYSPSGKVPVLRDGQIRLWDSLAICEYLAETYPEKALWPKDRAARAAARGERRNALRLSRSALEHADERAPQPPGPGRTPETLRVVARIKAIWNDCRARFGAQGDFLFGGFSIVDAMHASVASRFKTYAVELDSVGEARAETEVIPQYET